MKNTLLILFILIWSVSCTTGQTNKTQTPNFVFIMADDLGYKGISCFGNTYINTPHLDKLADEGLKFTDFHSNGAVCSPTRAALMTGKYQQRTGVVGVITAAYHRHAGLSPDEITIAEELKKYGYTNGIFGKWHLGYPKKHNPSLQGFDEFVGYVSGNVDFHAHIDQSGYLDWWNDTIINNEPGYTTDLITDYGVDFIKRNKDKPFFLYLPHEAPHAPYQGRNSKVLREVGSDITAKVPSDSIPIRYKEMVEVMDEGIGRIMQTLKETGVDDNTIVIFCSDNGASKNGDNGDLRGNKGSVYEGGHRVPAIIRYPGKVKAGTETDEAVLTMDILPTLLDFAGAKPSGENVDGVSFKKLLLNQEQLAERDLFWGTKKKKAIRSGDWKLVYSNYKGNKKIELFNITEDVNETKDVAANNPELVKELKQKLDEWDTDVNNGAPNVSR